MWKPLVHVGRQQGCGAGTQISGSGSSSRHLKVFGSSSGSNI